MVRSSPLAPSQDARLQQFGCERSVDIHCHVLPGVDDGPQNLGEAIALCRALVQDGLTDIIATPHQLGRWDGANHAREIRSAVADLQSSLAAANVPLTIHPGGEVRLDERIPMLIGSGKLLTLADQGIHLLMELPAGFNMDPGLFIPFLSSTGTQIVLAHAERYDDFTSDLKIVEEWIKQGVALQINAPALAQNDERSAAVWEWMRRGWVSLVATDSHSTGTRRPRMSEAIKRIIERFDLETARRVCIENPARILEGRQLVQE